MPRKHDERFQAPSGADSPGYIKRAAEGIDAAKKERAEKAEADQRQAEADRLKEERQHATDEKVRLAKEAAEELARYHGLDLDVRLKAKAKELDIRKDALKKEVVLLQDGYKAADALAAALGPEPWDEPVDGDSLLDGLVTAFQRYIVMELPGLQTLALWSVHTYCFECWQNTPRLHIRSPKRRSGKSRVRDVLACTAAKPIVAEGVTAAVVFRLTEDRQPTWLIDEIDQWLDPKGELVGIFNSGHAKGGQVLRCVGDEQRVQMFSVYTPLALCGIGKIKSDTLADRSIPITIRRKLKTEPVERFRLDHAEKEFEPLRRQIQRWVDDTTFGDPEIPAEVDHDRMVDNWWSLLAIADAAGGDWPERAREIMLQQYWAYDSAEDSGLDILLLKDIRDIFDELGQDKIFTKEMLNKLHLMAERPWGEYPNKKTGDTKPLSSNSLAYLLKSHEIEPKQLKIGGVNNRGYERSDFQDTWLRYVTRPDAPCQTATSLPSAVSLGLRGSGLDLAASVSAKPLPREPLFSAAGSGVAVQTPPEGGNGAYEPDADDLEYDRQERAAIQVIDGEQGLQPAAKPAGEIKPEHSREPKPATDPNDLTYIPPFLRRGRSTCPPGGGET